MQEADRPRGAGIRQLLFVLGEPIVGPVIASGGMDAEINDVVILDADDEPDFYHGDLVMIIGARGRKALRLVRTAARQGAAAVAVKVEPGDGLDDLKEVSAETGVVVLGVRPEVTWDQLDSLARGAVADARTAAGPDAGRPADLFTLAQTVAALTGGIVTIEDSANRVLAYSRSDDEVDELRRLSILGWQCPPDHLALLRSWGVLERLRAGDDVIRIDAHPELGIRKRLAIGIRVDEQLLGSIWVQEGRDELADGAEQALIGAARTAALQLVRRRTGMPSGLQLEQRVLSRILEGHFDPRTLADSLGTDLTKPAVVTAFALAGGAHRTDAGRPALELRREAMTSLVSVHSSASRHRCMVTNTDSRVYLMLPGLPERSGQEIATGLAGDIVRAAAQRLQLDVCAAVGSVVSSLDSLAESRAEADRVLDIIACGKGRRVATIDDVRSEVLVSELLALLDEHPRLRDPRISALIAYDADHDTGLLPSLLAFLGTLGNVRSAARSLHVHPNTLRYRLKRAEEVSGIDLSDPYQLLFTHLQLLLESGARPPRHGR